MSSSNSSPKVRLAAVDGSVFEVEEAVAGMSNTVKNLLDDADVGDGAPIPLANVAAPVLAKVIEYCTYHVRAAAAAGEEGRPLPSEEEVKAWDAEFVKVDQSMLFDLILAANYLDIKPLLDLTCQTVAGMLKGKTPEEIRKTFNIRNDWTPEEEEEVKREHQWAFD